MGRRGFVGTAGVVAALLLGAAGCGGDPEPQFAPPSETASPSSSASESASESPEPERLSREETVRAWVEARNEALQDGDTSGMSALYAPDCRGCDLMNAAIEDVYAAGGYYKTPGWTVLKTAAVGENTTDLLVRSAPGTAKEAAGAEVVQFPTATRELRFTYEGGTKPWLFSEIAVLTG